MCYLFKCTIQDIPTTINIILLANNILSLFIRVIHNLFIGGINNRFVKLNKTYGVEWVMDHNFGSPHSIAWERTRNYIWVADRSNNRTQTFDAKTGRNTDQI